MAKDTTSLLPEFVRSRYTVRLGFALALAIVVVVASGAVISSQAQATLQEDVQNDLVALSETRGQQLDTWMRSVKTHAQVTSEKEVYASSDTDQISGELSALTAGDRLPRDVVAIHVLDVSDGEIVASSNEQFVGVRPAEQGAPFADDPPQFDGPNDVYVSQPFEIGLVDHPILTVMTPVPGTEDRVMLYMTDLAARTNALSTDGGDTFTVVVDGQGRYVSHPDTSKILESHTTGDSDGMANGTRFTTTETENGTMLMGMSTMEEQNWMVMTHSPASQAYALGAQINADLIGLILLAVINLGLVGVTIGSGTAISLRRLSNRAAAMADGDLDVDLRSTRDDEIGAVFSAFDRMRESIRSNIREAEQAREEAEQAQADAEDARKEAERERKEASRMNEQLQRKAEEYGDVLAAVAAGDLTVRADTDVDNEAMADIAESINEAIADLEATIANTQEFAENVLESSQQVGESAQTVDEASQQVRQSIREIYEGASEQAESLQDAAAQMENLSATAEEVASSAQEVASTSQQAAQEGETGREGAQDAIEEMNAIEEETDATVREINELATELDEIGEIVQVITDIAEQTNILALNASSRPPARATRPGPATGSRSSRTR
jgi:methyl-accepting chemotaxis protein